VENCINFVNNSSLFFSVSFFESLSSQRKLASKGLFLLKVRLHATTGQSQGHLPASSIQILYIV